MIFVFVCVRAYFCVFLSRIFNLQCTRLKYFDGKDEFTSTQNIIILREKNNNSSSKILRFSKNSSIEIINNNEKILGLTLDIVEYLHNNSLMLTGRTNPNSLVKLFFSDIFI